MSGVRTLDASALPGKAARPGPVSIEELRAGLTCALVGGTAAPEPWTFYEVVDAYLGPWGSAGYPIGYGKFYCMAFNRNRKLRDNPATRDWIRATTVLLQKALRDFLVQRFGEGSLARLTEPELRDFAFQSHPRAYAGGGLAEVIVTAPEMLPVIASIPAAEFDPASPDFHETVEQAIATVHEVAPEVAAEAAGILLPPSFVPLFERAHAAAERLRHARSDHGGRLGALRAMLRSGRLDSAPVLSRIAAHLRPMARGDTALAHAAREIVDEAEERRRDVAAFYAELLAVNPALRPFFDREAPGWAGP